MTELSTRAAPAAQRRDGEVSLRACVQVVLEHALRAAPGADGAALTAVAAHGRQHMIDDSGSLAAAFCEVQERLGSGPVPEAVTADVVVVPDLATDGRWPQAAAALLDVGVRSLLCVRLRTVEDGALGVLSLVAARENALTAGDVAAVERVRVMVSVALSALRTREQVDQLEQAVRSNRDIGVAMGILMAHRLITRDEAFELLRRASQQSHRKLVAVADDVIRTGVLEYP